LFLHALLLILLSLYLYQIGTQNFKTMVIISSREFRDNQKKYFDLVDQNEQVIVQRGKRKSYMLSPLSEIDRMSTNPELIAKIKKAEEEIAAGNVVTINSSEDIKTFLGL
jgi:antitoxin YefM